MFSPKIEYLHPNQSEKKHQPHTPWNLQSRAIQQLLQIEIGPIGNCRCLHVKRRDPISTPISNSSPKKHCRLGDGCLATSVTGYQFNFTGCQFRWLPVAWLPVSLATSHWLPAAWLPVSLAASFAGCQVPGYQFHWLPVTGCQLPGYQFHWLPVTGCQLPGYQFRWLPVLLADSFAGWQFPGRQVCATWPFNMLTNIAGNTKMRALAHRKTINPDNIMRRQVIELNTIMVIR